jgi:DNA-binding transcriptional LysR family regulator
MAHSEPRPQDIHTEDLRVLLAVARSGRLNSAALLLGVDHTTIRRRLDRLEATLKTRLLQRGTDGWELTQTGRAVVKQATPLEQIVAHVVGAASGTPDEARGPVQVFAPEGFGVAFVSRAIGRVRSQFPGITVDMVTYSRPVSSRPSGFDIAITVGSSNPLRQPAAHLSDFSMRLYATQDYLAQHPRIRSAEDLGAHSLIFYGDALLTVRELDVAPALRGMQQGFGSTSVFAHLEATRHGAGIGLLPTFIGRRAPNLVEVLPDDVDFRLGFFMSTRAGTDGVDAVEVVRRAIVREVDERGSDLIPPARATDSRVAS